METLSAGRRGAEAAKVLGAATVCGTLLLLLKFAPAASERMFPPCLWKVITGLYCPGCGIARALRALVNFDLVSAFVYNPFLFIMIIPLTVYFTAIFTIRAVTGRWTPSILSSPKSVAPALTIITAIWILRNVFPPPQ